ncbi:MAG: DUF305 domain-containing protein [Chloroflexi bacterium]|nr:DUF305 domain-containing protein [Chloroflexota bacterium]
MRLRVVLVSVLVVVAVALAAPVVFGHGPVADRLGRSELRFMEGMIDHHQMALDMAADCVAREISAELRAECEAVIAAQQPEIEQMQAWLLEWYNVDYTPMSMADMGGLHGGGDIAGMMAPMMGMMDSMMQMDMPGEMRDMMNQMRGMMAMMGMMHGGGMGMDMMGGSMGGMGHGGHGAQPTAIPSMGHGGHGGHGGAATTAPHTDPAMMMGMFAGFNRLTGVEYEIAWLESMIDHHDDAIHMSERLLARGDTGHAELRDLAQAIIDAQSAEIARYEELIAALKSS